MTFWNLYFIIKLALFSTGHLKPLWLANLGFAAALAVSSPLRSRVWRAVRFVAGLGIGLPLMYREANVPPFARIVENSPICARSASVTGSNCCRAFFRRC